MMRRAVLLLGLSVGLLAAATCAAHEGEVHRDEGGALPLSAAALAERPRRLPDGELFLPKPAQRLLGIRTVAWSADVADQPLSLVAEVQAQPAEALTLGGWSRGMRPGRCRAKACMRARCWPGCAHRSISGMPRGVAPRSRISTRS